MQYVTLFRGINVGGKNVVKMYDLKQLFTELGMYNVKTYIQSGNVVFESDSDKASLHSMIYKGFINYFGFESDVMIRDVNEMTDLVKLFPFSEEEISYAEAADPEVEHIYVYFLDNPNSKLIDDMCKEFAGPDIIRPGKNEIYLLCHQSIRKSKLAIRIVKIFNSATARNWKTVNKLYNLMDTMIS